MSDTIHRRRPISMIVLMALLVSFVLPFATLRPMPAVASPTAPSAIGLDGILEAEYGAAIATDPAGDLAASGPGSWVGVAWSDQTALYATTDATTLYVYAALPNYDGTRASDPSQGQIGLVIDTDSPSGGTTDPWGTAITFGQPFLPDYLVRGNLPTNGNTGWTELRTWNGTDWSTGSGTNWGGLAGAQTGASIVGTNIAYANGAGVEFAIPLADIGVSAGDVVRLEVFGTQEGAGKGAYDTVPTDTQSTGWDTPTLLQAQTAYTLPLPLDGILEAAYGAAIATDPAGDLAASGPGSWIGVAWSDQTALYAFHDATTLYVYAALPNYDGTRASDPSQGQIGLVIDTDSPSGGTTDPWGTAITFGQPFLPDYLVRGNLPTNGNTGWTELRTWNGTDWSTGSGTNWGGLAGAQTGASIVGTNIAYANGAGVEFAIPFADIGVSAGDVVRLEVFGTQEGAGKGAYDTVPTDTQSTGWDTPTLLQAQVGFSLGGVIEEPESEVGDGLINKAAIRHDSRDSLYKVPFGAITLGTSATLRLRTAAHDVESVKVRLYNTADNSQSIKALSHVATDPAGEYAYWEYQLPAHDQIGVVYYRFIVADGATTVYYEDDSRYDGGLGETVISSGDRSWNIYIYEPDFDTPEWAKNAVIYQIFVERFHNGDPTNDPTANPADAYAGETTPTRGWFYPDERAHRFPIAPWNSIVPDPEPYADTGREYWATYSSTMYGGDLKGVQDKLDYLDQLGVTTLYLNPIFDSPSNHKYDGRDYRTVDPAFGGPEAFAALATAAHARGMYLVLDGVPNHVSSDSPYFDRFGRHPGSGACESQNSPYRSWFFFQEVPAGTGKCVSSSGVVNGANYTGWFGVQSLPQINTAHPEVMAYWFGTPGGDPNLPSNTAAYWVTGDDKADGWRIDVVPDVVGVNPTFFETWRDTMKAANPESVLYSETWPEEVVRDRVLGDEFDSTMNYRYRKAVLGFLRDTRWTDNDGGQEVDPLSPSQFIDAFTTMQEDYPKPAFDAAMNLIDSHDTNRAVHVLNEQGFTGTGYNRQPVDGFADARQRLGMVAVLQMTLPGAPTIYYGDEVGLTGFGFDVPRDDPYNRQPYPWADAAGYADLPEWRKADNNLLSHYQALGQLRGDHSFLRTGSFDPLLADDANKVLAYGRKDGSGAAIVVMNRDDAAHTVELDLKTYIPTGVTLDQVLPTTGTAAPAGNTYQFVVPANSYGIWVTPANVNMAAPLAPTNLAITQELSQSVALQWTAVANASSYNVYRSLVSGGGYALVGNTAGTTFTDAAVTTGAHAYYVVKAVGANGFESAASNEVVAVPSLAITNAVIISPATMVHTIGITPTQPFTARITVPGLTNVAGDESVITAEIGYGPLFSNPETWSTWWPMSHDAACANCAGAYQFSGRVRPDSLGTFGVLVRFSTNAGYTWTYGDLNGPAAGQYRVFMPFLAKSGGAASAQAPAATQRVPVDVPARQYDSPAVLNVVASSDTTPPAAPANLRATGWSADAIALEWNAAAGAAEYWLYRRVGAASYAAPLVRLSAPTTAYTDTAVTTGITYTYAVRAVDPALNLSALSNEVSQQAALRVATVTFRVRVPDATPEGDTVYIAGNSADAFGQTWNPDAQPMTEVEPNVWEHSVQLLEGTELQYKYTRGAWERVEWWGEIVSVNNRTVTTGYGPGGTFLIDNTATDWGTGPDSTKAVQLWRDPVVASTLPVSSGVYGGNVTATWLQPVEATTTESAILTVMNGATPVAGTVARIDPETFAWTPDAALTPGTYTVTAFNVKRSDIGGEAVPQAAPYTWTFTVQ